MKYVFSVKICSMKTSVKIMKYKSQLVKSNPFINARVVESETKCKDSNKDLFLAAPRKVKQVCG